MSNAIKNNKNYSPTIGIVLSIITFFMPLPNGMTIEGQKSLAIFVSALIMWVTKPIPIYQTSIIAILLLPLVGAVENQKWLLAL
ncbi:anion permease [Globicatella sulfidifaciens]